MSKLIDITGLAEFRRKSKAEHDALAALVDDIMFILDIQYPLTFTATENSTIGIKLNGSNMGWSNVQYSVNNGAWRDYTLAASANMISLAKGSNIKWRAHKDGQNQSGSNYIKFVMTGKLEGSGNITSLLNGVGGVQSLASYGQYTFCNLFNGCGSLVTAPALSSTTLVTSCYMGMFNGCTSLVTAPVSLPATTLYSSCYAYMFLGCRSLTEAPDLPALTLASSCYYLMFQGCTSLTSAPALPATTLVGGCYYHMFYGCTRLNNVHCAATDISAANCLKEWLVNVSDTGDFYTPSATDWPSGTSGIPSGWTRHNE